MSRLDLRSIASRGRRWYGPRAQIWLGLLLGVGALVIAIRAFDFQRLGDALLGVKLPFVALTLASSLLSPVLKAVRWRWLFHPQRPSLGVGRLASLVVIGQAVNFAIPGRLGELVRAYLTGEEANASKAYVLGTIAAEKLLDVVVLAVLFVALIPFVALPDWLAGRVGPVVLAALAVILLVVALLGARRTWLSITGWALRLLPEAQQQRWHARIAAGLDGLGALGRPAAAAAIWGWTLAFWLVSGLTNLLLLLAFDLPPSPVVALFVLAVLQGGCGGAFDAGEDRRLSVSMCVGAVSLRRAELGGPGLRPGLVLPGVRGRERVGRAGPVAPQLELAPPGRGLGRLAGWPRLGRSWNFP